MCWVLVYLVDVNEVINILYYGYVELIIGLIYLKKFILYKGLDFIKYDVEKVKVFFMEVGWEDVNGDGILDCEIDGEWVDFLFIYLEY